MTNPTAGEPAFDRIRDALRRGSLLKLTLSRNTDPDTCEWQRIVVRPITLRDSPQFQFSFFDRTRDLSSNFPPDRALVELDRILQMPFAHLYLAGADSDTYFRRTKRGRILHSTSARNNTQRATGQHDKHKTRSITPRNSLPLLLALGICDPQGRILPAQQAKYKQIDGFIRILAPCIQQISPTPDTLRIADLGCGNAWLTFAAAWYVSHLLRHPLSVTGIDHNPRVINNALALRESLTTGPDLTFLCMPISDYKPEQPPHVVLALHACDQATDEALAAGIRAAAPVILAAPCCQHEISAALAHTTPFEPVMKQGILRQRLADILTDALRALLLQLHGYDTDVFEFVSPDATARNIMLRAIRRNKPANHTKSDTLRQYLALRDFWQVTPALERLVGLPAS